MSLSQFLAKSGFESLEGAFRDRLGCNDFEDLKFVNNDDLTSIGIRGVKQRRFIAAVAEFQPAPARKAMARNRRGSGAAGEPVFRSFGDTDRAPPNYSFNGSLAVHSGGMDDRNRNPDGLWIEFDVDTTGGPHAFSVQYAATDPRPTNFFIGDEHHVAEETIAGGVTGGWGPQDVLWEECGIVDVGAPGRTTIGFKSPSFLPHFAAFKLQPMPNVTPTMQICDLTGMLEMPFDPAVMVSAPSNFQFNGAHGGCGGGMEGDCVFEVTHNGGNHSLAMKYASQDPRSLDLSVNGGPTISLCSATTNGWGDYTWFEECEVDLGAPGVATLSFHAPSFCGHLAAFALNSCGGFGEDPGQRLDNADQIRADLANVQALYNPGDLVVYGRHDCGVCETLKCKLEAKGIDFQFADCDDPANNAEMWAKVAAAGLPTSGLGLPVVDCYGDGTLMRPSIGAIKKHMPHDVREALKKAEPPPPPPVEEVRNNRAPTVTKVKKTETYPTEVDWSAADPSCWSFDEFQFPGSYGWSSPGGSQPEKEEFNGDPEEGKRMMRDEPTKWEAMMYQTDYHPTYTMFKRTGANVSAQPTGGPFTWVASKYQEMDSNTRLRPDNYTDSILNNYKGQYLDSTRPGRGGGSEAELPNLCLIKNVDPKDVAQGGVGDCWMLSSISALAEYDGAIKKIFRKSADVSEAKHSSGMYTCTLYDLTKPDGNTFKEVDIVVDERLTCAPNGSKSLFGCKPSLMSELWVCYLEKAMAAQAGGWDAIDGGDIIHGWAIMTGCRDLYSVQTQGRGQHVCAKILKDGRWGSNSVHDIPGRYLCDFPHGNGSRIGDEELFELMCVWEDNNYLIGCGTNSGSDTQDHEGIVDGHAYTVLGCVNDAAGIPGIDLIKVRNPWGRGEFRSGTWDDDGPGWNQHPKVKDLLQPKEADDGIFWVDKSEFFHYFPSVSLMAMDMSEFLEDEMM